MHYREKGDEPFENSSFNIVLLKRDNWVKAGCNSYPQFNNSVIIDDGKLTAGRYHVVIDPVWKGNTCDKNPDYKKITVDVYCN